MRLLSNFDTGLENSLIQEYQQGFGDGKVISVHKSRWFYVMRVLFPYAYFIFAFGIGLYAVYMLEFEGQLYAQWAFWVVMAFYLFYTVITTTRQYMNWKMDFMIITPKEVIKFDQNGVLHRETETIHVDKIKSVTVVKHGLLNSLLDIGTITFLAEGEDNKGDIVMSHIDAVEQVERKIRGIMGMNTQ